MPVAVQVTVELSSDALAAASDSAPRDWALDPITGDLALDPATGDAVFSAGSSGVVSDLKSRLLTFLGEWFLDTTIGFPWFQDVLGQKHDAGKVRSAVEKAALDCPGVDSVGDVTTSVSARELSIVFSATLDTGQVVAVAIATQGV